MALSAMELQLGVLGFLPTTPVETYMQTKVCERFSRAVWPFHAHLSSHSDHSTYAPDESQLF